MRTCARRYGWAEPLPIPDIGFPEACIVRLYRRLSPESVDLRHREVQRDPGPPAGTACRANWIPGTDELSAPAAVAQDVGILRGRRARARYLDRPPRRGIRAVSPCLRRHSARKADAGGGGARLLRQPRAVRAIEAGAHRYCRGVLSRHTAEPAAIRRYRGTGVHLRHGAQNPGAALSPPSGPARGDGQNIFGVRVDGTP